MTQTTPTRDEALFRALIEELRPYAARPLGSIRIDTDDIRKIVDWFDASASAPAPANGRVDAGRVTLFSALEAAYIRGAAWCAEMGMTHTFAELRKAAYDYADKEEKDVICREVSASLSPAATPVSEAGNWRDIKTAPKGRRVLVKFQSGEVEVCYQTDHGGGLMDSWRYAFARRGEQAPWPVEWCEIPLAKPASSPAGGDVLETARGVMAAWEMHPGTLDTPKRLAKWFDENMSPAIIALRAALSQSTSAGRSE